MSDNTNDTPAAPLSGEDAQELLRRAQQLGTTTTASAGWPAAMVFNSLAIIGSLLMICLHIVAHTGYGAPILALTTGFWAFITTVVWIPVFQRSTKRGFGRRFTASLLIYFVCYTAAVFIGVSVFPEGNLIYYATAAGVLALIGTGAALREVLL